MDTLQILTHQNVICSGISWNAIIGVATVAYVIFAALLWFVSNNTLKLTKQIFEATNRPFVFPELPKIDWSKPHYIQTVIRNNGRMPANSVSFKFFATFSDNNNEKDVTGKQSSVNSLTIFPDSTVEKDFAINNEHADIAGICTSQYERFSLVIGIDITYRGITKQEYATHCKYRYDMKLKKFEIIETII
jgi:hypothetical protein